MEWIIDPSHTSVEFAVRHMAISTVRGRFKKVSGTIETDDGTLKSIQATIEAASIDTAEPQRDVHLRSPDFLDADNQPYLQFRSRAVEARGAGRYRVTGDLTIRGLDRAVSFEVETSDPVIDPYGNRRAGATASAKLNRKDWGLTWNQVLEFGALLVGEEVRFTLDVQAIVPASTQAA